MTQCPDCAIHLPEDALLCAECGALVWRDKLQELYESAGRARGVGDWDKCMSELVQCLDLLPAETRQREGIRAQIDEVTHRINHRKPEINPESLVKPEFESTREAPAGAVGRAAFVSFFRGLSRPQTWISLIVWVVSLSFVLGWKMSLAFALLIYVHEMGHVLVIQYFGYRFSWPIFVPFLGAFVIHGNQERPRFENIAIALGGPFLGVLPCFGVFFYGLFGALPEFVHRIAYIGLLINFFNLLPVWMLDGARISQNLGRRHFVLIVVILIPIAALQLNGFALIMAGGWIVAGLIGRKGAKRKTPEPAPDRTADVLAVVSCTLIAVSAVVLQLERLTP